MIKKILSLLVVMTIITACRPKVSEPYFEDGIWYWPGHEGQLHNIDKYYFIDAHGQVKKRRSASSIAPYPFPKEPDTNERKIHGVAESEWNSFSPAQQAEIKRNHQ